MLLRCLFEWEGLGTCFLSYPEEAAQRMKLFRAHRLSAPYPTYLMPETAVSQILPRFL